MNTIETRVMANVAVIRTVRSLLSYTAFKFYAIAFSLWGIGRLVWVSKVFENFSLALGNGLENAVNYAIVAVGNTQIGVQLMILVCVCAVISLAIDAIRPTARGLAI